MMVCHGNETDLGKTITRLIKPDLGPPQVRLMTVPTLSPVAGKVFKPVCVLGDEFVIGRQADVQLQLRDECITTARSLPATRGRICSGGSG